MNPQYSILNVPLRIKKLHDDVVAPSYSRPGDAGLDVRSREEKVLLPNEQYIFKTGFAIAIPEGTVGLIWDRSGMAGKNGIKVMGGVLDHTFRGELGVVLVNVSTVPYTVQAGDRIAQLVIQPVLTAVVNVVDELEATERAAGGFGSSGR